MSRSETEWIPHDPVTVGHAEGESESTSDHPVAVLWVPDPEQRHGWREFYVRRPEKPNGKRVGFQKR